MVSQGSEKRTIGRTVEDGDTVAVRDENGVIVVEMKAHGKRQRQEITVPAGFTVEHKPRMPQGGEETT